MCEKGGLRLFSFSCRVGKERKDEKKGGAIISRKNSLVFVDRHGAIKGQIVVMKL